MRLIAALALILAASLPAATQPVDLELVLAVDVSRSMDPDEQRLQRDGYVAALTHPAVLAAIASGPHRRIAIAYLEWGGPNRQRVLLDWTVIGTEAEAFAAASALAGPPLQSSSGTSISGGLLTAARMIAQNAFDAERRVIDISGDGPNNMGAPVAEARAAVLAQGIEINGLPILLRTASGPFALGDLDLYYEDCVIGGPSAFVIPVRAPAEFVAAIRQKLVTEISGTTPPARIRPVAPIDCMIGEKMRRRWLEERQWE